MLVRQRLQQDAIDHAEYSCVRADTEPEYDNCRYGEAEILAHHAQRESGILFQHGEMFARRGGEDTLRGFPPEARDSHLVAVAFGLGALIGEDLLHFGAVIAAKFGGQEAKQKTVATGAAALGFRHT